MQLKHLNKIKNILHALLNTMLVPDGPMAYVPITLITIAIFIGSSWQVFLPTTDPARYQCYALTFWFGSNATHLLPAVQCDFLKATITSPQGPFHLLPLEYPPLTLLPFSLALLVPLSYYQLAIAFIMALSSVFVYWLLLQYGPRGAALAFALCLFIGALGTAQSRFDLLPATLTLICVIAAERRHWTLAYVALALGVLLKLYPILLLPALFLAEQRFRGRLLVPKPPYVFRTLPRELWIALQGVRGWYWRNLLICLGSIVAVTGLFALLNFQGAVVAQVSYFLQRPVQVEATGSTLLWLLQGLGFPLTIGESFGSLNIISNMNGIVSALGTLGLVIGYLSVLLMQWRNKLDLTQAAIAILFVFIATGKVFSPQYLMWLMPLLAYAGAFDLFWIFCWGAVSLLTTYIYVFLYTKPVTDIRDVPFLPGFFETVSVRNAFIVFILLAYLLNWFHARQRKQLPVGPGGKVTRPLTRPLKELLSFQLSEPT